MILCLWNATENIFLKEAGAKKSDSNLSRNGGLILEMERLEEIEGSFVCGRK